MSELIKAHGWLLVTIFNYRNTNFINLISHSLKLSAQGCLFLQLFSPSLSFSISLFHSYADLDHLGIDLKEVCSTLWIFLFICHAIILHDLTLHFHYLLLVCCYKYPDITEAIKGSVVKWPDFSIGCSVTLNSYPDWCHPLIISNDVTLLRLRNLNVEI